MDQLIALLPATGAMAFSAFVQAARDAGVRPDLWLRAKHAGQLFTWIDANGQLLISRNPEPGS